MRSKFLLNLVFFLFILSVSGNQAPQQFNNAQRHNTPRTLEVTQLNNNQNDQTSAQNQLNQNSNQGNLNLEENPQSNGNQPQAGVQKRSLQNMMPTMTTMAAGNSMAGNAMMNPLVNPMSPASPFSPMNMMNPMTYQTLLYGNQGAGMNQAAGMNQNIGGRFVPSDPDDGYLDQDSSTFPLGTHVDLSNEVFDDAGGLRVLNKCHNVKVQAIEIANRIMKKQNHKIFKELVGYLVKSKFLIGMTEIKLTRALRKRVFGLMTAFSSLDHDQINFVDPEPHPEDYDMDE